MNKLFTCAFLFFMISMTIHRFWSVLFKIDKIKGKIIKGWTLYALSIIHITIGVIAIIEYMWSDGSINYFITIIGLVMFSMALLGSTWASNTLGRYHSAQIEIRKDHPLIKLGPYKYIRHPIYLFNIIELLGFPLIPNSYYAFLLSLFIYTPLLLFRLFFEEKARIEKFGNNYIKYSTDVPCLIPFTKDIKNRMSNLF